MVRPLSGLLALAEAMKSKLEAAGAASDGPGHRRPGRAGDGGEPGDRPRNRRGARPRGRAGRDREPHRGESKPRRRRSTGRCAPSSPTPPTSIGWPSCRARSRRRWARSRSWSSTPAGRRRAGAPTTTLDDLGGRLPLAGAGPAGAGRRRAARDARARLGADRQRRLHLDPRADPGARTSPTSTAWRRSAS